MQKSPQNDDHATAQRMTELIEMCGSPAGRQQLLAEATREDLQMMEQIVAGYHLARLRSAGRPTQ